MMDIHCSNEVMVFEKTSYGNDTAFSKTISYRERERVFGEERTLTFYDWWVSQRIDFGLYESGKDDI